MNRANHTALAIVRRYEASRVHAASEPTHATPEQMLDDGRADGVKLRTLADVQREQAERADGIARTWQGQKTYQPRGKAPHVVYIRDDGVKVLGIKGLAELVGATNIGSVMRSVKTGWKFRGHLWTKREVEQ